MPAARRQRHTMSQSDDGHGSTVHVGEEVQDGEEHSLATSGSVCSRSDRMVNRREPLRRSQIAVQAGKQASRQPASMSQRQRQRQSQSQKPGLRMNLAAAAVL